MKRVIAVLSLIMVLAMSTTCAFGLSIEDVTPKDGKGGLQVNNLAVKVRFSEDMRDTANDSVNAGKIAIYDAEGKKADLSCQVAHPEKYPNELWFVFEGILEPDQEYTIRIDSGIKSSFGGSSDSQYTSTFKTRNTKTDSIVSVVMMIGMFAVMFIATGKAAKKAASSADPRMSEKQREEALNPYKIAREKGISLDEAKAYVAKEKEKYKREQERIEAEYAKKEAQRQAEIDALEKQIEIELASYKDPFLFHVKERASIRKTGREVPKAVIKIRRRRAEQKLAKEKAAEEARLANMRGKKAKK